MLYEVHFNIRWLIFAFKEGLVDLPYKVDHTFMNNLEIQKPKKYVLKNFFLEKKKNMVLKFIFNIQWLIFVFKEGFVDLPYSWSHFYQRPDLDNQEANDILKFMKKNIYKKIYIIELSSLELIDKMHDNGTKPQRRSKIRFTGEEEKNCCFHIAYLPLWLSFAKRLLKF